MKNLNKFFSQSYPILLIEQIIKNGVEIGFHTEGGGFKWFCHLFSDK